MSNSFGNQFVIHTFGESHGAALGVVVDGCPAGVSFSPELIENWCSRRRPGQVSASGDVLVSSRDERDQPEVLSGVFEGKTLGTPIAMVIRNTSARSEDYSRDLVREGHADDIWQTKFGVRDFRGGGRSSGRETVSRVLGAAVAQMLCQQLVPSLSVVGFSQSIGPHHIEDISNELTVAEVEKFNARFPSEEGHEDVAELLREAKLAGESYGGVVGVHLNGIPPALGNPVFKKLKSELSAAFLSIGATIGVEFGNGFESLEQPGTSFHSNRENYGGLRGGMSSGEMIRARVGFKPTSSILDVAKKGRHDPCIVPRAVPVVEAMAWLVLADQLLGQRLDKVL